VDIASSLTSRPVRIGGVPKRALVSVFCIATKVKGEGDWDGKVDGKGKGSTEWGSDQ
jgi:hypothetical protein